MASRRRTRGGHFAPDDATTDTSKPAAFDPAAEAEALYRTLIKNGEYVSAASVLTKLLGRGAPEDDADSYREQERQADLVLIRAMTPEERERMRSLVVQVRELREGIRRRLAGAPEPVEPVPIVETPAREPMPIIEEDPPLGENEIELPEGTDISWLPEATDDDQ